MVTASSAVAAALPFCTTTPWLSNRSLLWYSCRFRNRSAPVAPSAGACSRVTQHTTPRTRCQCAVEEHTALQCRRQFNVRAQGWVPKPGMCTRPANCVVGQRTCCDRARHGTAAESSLTATARDAASRERGANPRGPHAAAATRGATRRHDDIILARVAYAASRSPSRDHHGQSHHILQLHF